MKILVTGASGQLGSQVVEQLLKTYKDKIIAGSRSVEKLEGLKVKGVEIRKVDFDDPATTDEAFKNVDKLLIISTDSIAVPGLRLKQHLNAVASAKKNNVKHIVYTSLSNADDSPISFAPDHAGSEKAIIASGIPYTFLRNNWYFENLGQAIGQAKQTGTLMTATDKGKVGFVTRADCALVAAAVLIGSDYQNQTIEVTNSEAYAYADIAKALNVDLVKLTLEQLKTGMQEHGLPGFVIDLLATYEQAVATNKMNLTNDLIQKITGKKATSLIEFMRG
jgi:NAD(P)H dehydrogenase (quinone)